MQNTTYYAEILADSINPSHDKLTSFVITLPRIVLAEFNTHRVISRNSASSRAIPFEKMLKRCEETPFIPLRFQKDHSGMQGTEYFKGKEHEACVSAWLKSRDAAIKSAKTMADMNVTKQIVNRILEPYMWTTIICTASEWENFFNLRADGPAEIHMQKISYMMLMAYNISKPKKLKFGEWHIPFGDKMDWLRLQEADDLQISRSLDETKIKIATARCARVSYLNFDGTDNYQNDIKLHDRLSTCGHWSPFEHCARATVHERNTGNFTGWEQYRKTFMGENRKDLRVAIQGRDLAEIKLPEELFFEEK